jgi:MFS family permease
MWTWISAFLFAAAAGVVSDTIIDLVVFGTIAAGALGCVLGGIAADRIGRHRVVNLAMAISGSCCLSAGFLFHAPFALLVCLTWIWGFFVVADSAQFSALVTEVAPQDSVGTALMLQTSLGFLLTMVTIQAVPAIVGAVDWQWAFTFLALGPMCGICSILLLARR